MKSHTLEDINYAFDRRSRKWNFSFINADGKNISILIPCGGAEKAHKVAQYVKGGLKRTKKHGIDGIARNNIDRFLSAKTETDD